MNRFRYALGLGGLALTAALATFVVPVLAHEGHGKVETAVFDLDSPRIVSPETAAVIGLETAEVDFGTVEDVLRLTGTVRPLPDRVEVIAPRIGGTVTAVHVRPGDRVSAGDIVAEIESPEFLRLLADAAQVEARINRLTVEIDSGRGALRVAEESLARVQGNTDAVSANLLSDRQAAAIAARGEVARLEAELAQARTELESVRRLMDSIRTGPEGDGPAGRLSLVAGIDGVVIARDATLGQGVEAGQPLLRIGDYSRVQIEGELPESLVDRLGSSSGNTVRVRVAPEGEPITTGEVRFVSPVVDPTTRTTHVVVEANNDGGRLRDGQYVDLAIVLREAADAVVVPASAVLSDGPMHFVFVQEGTEGKVFKKHDITPGATDDRLVEVVQGLVPGDVVVTQGAYSLTQLRPKATAVASTEAGPTAAPAGDGHGHTH